MAFRQKLWQTKKFFKCISNSLISISRIGLYMHSRSSLENHTPILDQNEQSVYRFSDQKVPKTIPFGVAHTYMAYTREYLAPLPMGLLISIILLMSDLKATNF